MSRLGRVAKAVGVALTAAGMLYIYVPVVLAGGMNAFLKSNASDAKAEDDWETHQWSIEEAVAWNPHDYHGLYRLGFKCMQRGEPEQARELYLACLENSPGHLGALLGLSELHLSTGEFDRARELLERARTVAPTSWRVYVSSGMIESRAGNHDQALALLETAERFARKPEPSIYNQMALALLLKGDGEGAVRAANRSLDAAPGDGEALLVKGKALALLERFEDAAEVLRAAARRLKNSRIQRTDARLHLAGALLETGAVLQASELVRDEVRASPNETPVRVTGDRLLRRIDERLAAADSVGRLGEVRCNLGFAYAALGRLEEAIAQFEAAARTGEELEAACVWAHAESLMRMERAEEAVARYKTAIAMGGAPVQMRLGFAEALTRAGRTRDAYMQYVLLLRGHDLDDEERAKVEALMKGLQ